MWRCCATTHAWRRRWPPRWRGIERRAGRPDIPRAAEAAATTTGSLANRARLFGSASGYGAYIMTKGEMRAEARRRLRALADAERAAAEGALDRRVWTVPEIASARVLLLFADLPEEVTTDAIAAEALRRG